MTIAEIRANNGKRWEVEVDDRIARCAAVRYQGTVYILRLIGSRPIFCEGHVADLTDSDVKQIEDRQ